MQGWLSQLEAARQNLGGRHGSHTSHTLSHTVSDSEHASATHSASSARGTHMRIYQSESQYIETVGTLDARGISSMVSHNLVLHPNTGPERNTTGNTRTSG